MEASAPEVVGSLPPLEEFDAPMYNQNHQELRRPKNIVENPAVQEQVIVQEVPQVSIVERIQEQIVSTVQPHVLFQEIPEVKVCPFFRIAFSHAAPFFSDVAGRFAQCIVNPISHQKTRSLFMVEVSGPLSCEFLQCCAIPVRLRCVDLAHEAS